MFIVLVGSKSDLTQSRAVPAVFAQNLQKNMPNCKFTIETSAYEDVHSINQLFTQIGREIIKGNYYTQKWETIFMRLDDIKAILSLNRMASRFSPSLNRQYPLLLSNLLQFYFPPSI